MVTKPLFRLGPNSRYYTYSRPKPEGPNSGGPNDFQIGLETLALSSHSEQKVPEAKPHDPSVSVVPATFHQGHDSRPRVTPRSTPPMDHLQALVTTRFLASTCKRKGSTADTEKQKKETKIKESQQITVKDTVDTVDKKWKEIKDFFPNLCNKAVAIKAQIKRCKETDLRSKKQA
ncbi:hypothetical protein CXB51_001087 [Gossypium anomalum]|uniref:Uncharacterized protein n=1 Tax=Gossypium anomalum TaxID=47600 RepID=A0A8J5ZR61_9ROSI|nr:hypothetical protein CXB51_001087 [Gossypium anomalum]